VQGWQQAMHSKHAVCVCCAQLPASEVSALHLQQSMVCVCVLVLRSNGLTTGLARLREHGVVQAARARVQAKASLPGPPLCILEQSRGALMGQQTAKSDICYQQKGQCCSDPCMLSGSGSAV